MQLAGYLWWIGGVCSLPVTVWSDRREGWLSAGPQRKRQADAPLEETPWSFVTLWLLCLGFIICLCLNSSCQVQPITFTVLVFISSDSKKNSAKYISVFLFQTKCEKIWMKKTVTSGIKAQASVFNVWGHPCLCVGASGSMKGGSRGHFRHLPLSCTTHPSICVRCCPSVHSHTLTDRQIHTERYTP